MKTYTLLFLIYSIFGWVLETLFVFICNKKLVNRGFLFGPYCPIYGCGAILLTLFLSNFKNNIIILISLTFLICSIVEYLISYLMEKMFKLRWWDYSKRKFNINGRICLENMIYFTFFGVAIIKYINPYLINFIHNIPNNISNLIALFGSIILTVDFIISLFFITKLKKIKKNTKKDSTEEIKKEISKSLN